MIIKQYKHKITYYKTKQQAKMGAANEKQWVTIQKSKLKLL